MNLREGHRVKVYRNLHKKCWSVVCMERGDNYGLVLTHVRYLSLKDCEFRVSQPGRQRVLKEKQKNVHAYVLGHVAVKNKVGYEVTYDPYKYKTFVMKDNGKEVNLSSSVYFDHNMKVYIDKPV